MTQGSHETAGRWKVCYECEAEYDTERFKACPCCNARERKGVVKNDNNKNKQTVL